MHLRRHPASRVQVTVRRQVAAHKLERAAMMTLAGVFLVGVLAWWGAAAVIFIVALQEPLGTTHGFVDRNPGLNPFLCVLYGFLTTVPFAFAYDRIPQPLTADDLLALERDAVWRVLRERRPTPWSRYVPWAHPQPDGRVALWRVERQPDQQLTHTVVGVYSGDDTNGAADAMFELRRDCAQRELDAVVAHELACHEQRMAASAERERRAAERAEEAAASYAEWARRRLEHERGATEARERDTEARGLQRALLDAR